MNGILDHLENATTCATSDAGTLSLKDLTQLFDTLKNQHFDDECFTRELFVGDRERAIREFCKYDPNLCLPVSPKAAFAGLPISVRSFVPACEVWMIDGKGKLVAKWMLPN